MNRTHIYLTDEQIRSIKLRSLQEKKPEAQVIREFLDRGIQSTPPPKGQTLGEALLDLAALGKELGMTGPTDLSTHHDDYLYGDKE